MPAHAGRSIGLDIPRAVAISVVVLSHVVGIRLAYLGFFGVELFFALSGFLIGSILYQDFTANREWSLSNIRNFWARRWWRTLPNYYLFLFVFVIYQYFSGGLPSPLDFLRYLVFAQNLMNGDNPFYGVAWSLAIEEWFYLLFPLVLLLFSACGASKRVVFLLTMGLFVAVPVLMREILFTSTPASAVRMMTAPRLDAVFYGVAVSFWASRHQLGHAARATALVGGLIIVAPFVPLFALHLDSSPVYRLAYVAVPLGFALAMPFLKSIQQLPGAIAGIGPACQRISLWSYSIYLMHIPTLFAVYGLFGNFRQNWAVNVLSKVLAVIACVYLSKLVYEHFEVRLTQRRPERLRVASALDLSHRS
jgi:peptidoglycan/LPS O-acetylase OafA/YrhL